MPLQSFNPLLPAVRDDPYPIYRRYREEESVHLAPSMMPGIGACWYVFSYDEALALAKDKRVGRGPAPEMPPNPFAAYFKMLVQWMALLAVEGLELATEGVEWRKGMFARGPQKLPVIYTG